MVNQTIKYEARTMKFLPNWLISILVGSLVWALINGFQWFVWYVVVSAVMSVPYFFIGFVLEQTNRMKTFKFKYVFNTVFFVLATLYVYFTPSTLSYFSFTIVPYYLCGMIMLAFQETVLIEKKKKDKLNAE